MSVLILIITMFLATGQLDCSGVGLIQFWKYEDHISSCDDPNPSNPSNGCDFYFKPVQILYNNNTILYEIAKTDYTSDTPTVDLTTVEQLRDPVDVQLPTNKTVRIFISVWDRDDSLNEADEFLRNLNMDVPFSDKIAGESWTKKTYAFEGESRIKLAIKYRITSCDGHFTGPGCNFCGDNYYTATCNIYCKAVDGNYTCDPTTGQIICAPGKVGENCDECANKKIGQDCDTCRLGWAGDNCETCAQNYYPDGQCSVFCQQDPERYTCSDSGDRVCQRNWTGENCGTCTAHYYGDTCSIFCEETAYNTCTDSGEKVCQDCHLDRLWMVSGGAITVLFVTNVLAGLYILYLRRVIRSSSPSPVLELREVPGSTKRTPVKPGTSEECHLYDALYEEDTEDAEAPYDYAYTRSEDVVRHQLG